MEGTGLRGLLDYYAVVLNQGKFCPPPRKKWFSIEQLCLPAGSLKTLLLAHSESDFNYPSTLTTVSAILQAWRYFLKSCNSQEKSIAIPLPLTFPHPYSLYFFCLLA